MRSKWRSKNPSNRWESRKTFSGQEIAQTKLNQYDENGSKSSVNRGLFTNCLTRNQTKGLNIKYFYTQTDFNSSKIYIYRMNVRDVSQ